MRSTFLIGSILGLTLLAGKPTSPACTESDHSDDAVLAVQQESHADFPLRATLVPSLGDDLIFLKTGGIFVPHAKVPLFIFYSVTTCPYQLEKNEVRSVTVEVDNQMEWLVAFDLETHRMFLLRGSRNAVDEFNRLVQSLHLHVSEPSTALSIFDFFLKAVRGEGVRSRVVADVMQLQSVALLDFRSRFSPRRRRVAFDTWWKGLPSETRQEVSPPKATSTKTGFEVRYVLYESGSLHSKRLLINTDGTVVQSAGDSK